MSNIFKKLIDDALQQINDVKSVEQLEKINSLLLGKKGKITSKLKEIGSFKSEERANAGKQLNKVKQIVDGAIVKKKNIIYSKLVKEDIQQKSIDLTIPIENNLGSLHPISVVQYRLEDIFNNLGFEILDGPHIESDFYNFQALNFPENHPARDSQDTFYLSNEMLLRTQTSSIQIHAMEMRSPPLKIVGPGRVFRAERVDASHSSVFHQIEGMMIDKDISVANLIYFMKLMLSELFEYQVEIRVRPGYFPFVEPGFEMDMACLICKSKGCSACKQQGWLEILGCGLVHPNVLKIGNIDPDIFSGFAFGMGMDRIAMLKYGINDIRLLSGNSVTKLFQYSNNKSN